jgi:DNA-binding response OmpR family regulator
VIASVVPYMKVQKINMAILALEKDLFFAVKIRDTLQHHNQEVTIVRTLAAFEQALTQSEGTRPDLAIVNTATKGVDWEAAIRAAQTNHIPVLAFGSHMDLDARAKALQAGAGKVVANSKFASDMPGLVERMINNVSGVLADE